MLPVTAINDNQILESRVHLLPVGVESLTSYVLASKSRPELADHHRVTFDSADRPSLFECTCEAYTRRGKACWAAARAFDTLLMLTANNVRVAPLVSDDEGRERSADLDTDGDAPASGRELFTGRFECRRTARAPEPEGDPEAVLVVSQIVKRGRVERVRGFQI